MPKLSAGTKLYFSENIEAPEDDEFKIVPGITETGDVGDETPTIEITTLSDEAKKYMPGLAEGKDIEWTGLLEKDDPNQKAYRDAAKANKTVMKKIVYSNGIEVKLIVALTGMSISASEPGQPIKFTVKGKQSGKSIWSE